MKELINAASILFSSTIEAILTALIKSLAHSIEYFVLKQHIIDTSARLNMAGAE